MTAPHPLMSMTGFGSHTFEVGGSVYVLELRSVNGRHGDARVRLPWLAPVEEARLAAEARAAFHRGRLDVLLRAGAQEAGRGGEGGGALPAGGSGSGLRERLRDAQQDLERLVSELGLQAPIGMRDLFAYAELLAREDPSRRGPPSGFGEAASAALGRAVAEWNAMREREGSAQGAALESLLGAVEERVASLEGMATEQQTRLSARMRTRVEALLGELGVAQDALDESRLLGEIAMAVDRADVTEELTRLRSHIAQFRTTLVEGSPCGRKLDFLVQEMHREVNTTGAKVQDTRMSGLVVEAKAEIEKIREILQNIE